MRFHKPNCQSPYPVPSRPGESISARLKRKNNMGLRTIIVAWDVGRSEVPEEKHWRFLRVVYDLTNGDPEYGVETTQVAQIADIPYTIEDALAVSRELRNAELINETGPLGTIVSLTDDGKRFVEENS
jgi:hypothetical protein